VLCNIMFRRVGLPYGERVSVMQRNVSVGRPSLWRESKSNAT
jgi:hypothetical protein